MKALSVRLTALSAAALMGLAAAACTQQTEAPAEDATDTNTTTVIEREVPVPTAPVVVEREVPVPTSPVVIEKDRGDTTTVRAGEGGIEVETTNR